MKEYLAITKALSDPNRIRILFALRDGDYCVCQLIELLGLAPSTVSKHLYLLQQAGLVDSRKEGRWVHYRLSRKPAKHLVTRMIRETFRAVENSPSIVEDDKRMTKIRTCNLEKLCRKIFSQKLNMLR